MYFKRMKEFQLLIVTLVLSVALLATLFTGLASADTEANKAIARRLFEELWSQGNLDVIDELYTPTFRFFIGDHEAFKQYVTMMRTAFPDLYVTIDDQFAEGERVVTRCTVTATHKGEFMGIPPTGKQITVTWMDITRVIDGWIVGTASYIDELGLMQQIGVIPPDREEYAWGEPSEITGDPGDPETNKAIVLRGIEEIWNQSNLDVADELLHPDHFFNEAGYPLRGVDAYKENVAKWRSALSDLDVEVDVILAEGDKVATKVTFTGIHTGTLFGIPATMLNVKFTGTSISRIADGKAVETWMVKPNLEIMQLLQNPSVTEANKALHRYIIEEVYHKGNVDVYDEVYAADYPWSAGSVEATKQSRIELRAAFPDFHSTIEEQFAEGDLVAMRRTQTGTHTGEYMGIPPTGVYGTQTAIAILRIVDGKVVKGLGVQDDLGVLQQLGVIPADREVFSWGEPSEITGDPGDPETNKGIVLRIAVEVWNQGNLDIADKLLHPDYFLNEAGYPSHGVDAYKEVVAGWRSALLDLHVNTDVIFAEGDKVVTRWTVTGTHTGTALMGFPATGKELEFAWNTINRIADGKAVESWCVINRYGIMEQLMAKPPEGDFSNVFFLSLSEGLNMISLPLKPITPYTARTFAKEVFATTVIQLDEERQRFVGFTSDAPDNGFAIEGGKGYIVNVTEDKMISFTGAAWTNQPPVGAAPVVQGFNPRTTDGAWAFVVSGRFEDGVAARLCPATVDEYRVTVRNTRTNATATDVVRSGYFAAVFADLNRNNVVEIGDRLEVTVTDGKGEIVSSPLPYTVTTEAIRQAFLPVTLNLIPHRSLLLQNYPNPFNPETWIPYQLQESADVVIRIYNAQGRLVRTLDLGGRSAGFYLNRTNAGYWDGHNDAGEKVASGIYFYRLRAGNFSATRRMLIVK